MSAMMRMCIAAATVLALAGCAPYYRHYEKSADREAVPIVERINKRREKRDARGNAGGCPHSAAGRPAADDVAMQSTDAAARILTLEDALTEAFSNSRDYQFRKESLYLAALDFTLVRHRYDWIPSGNVTGDVTAAGQGDADGTTTADGDATLALSKRLLSGGTFSLRQLARAEGRRERADDRRKLLRRERQFHPTPSAGTGVAAREPLVQATRSLLYEARDFELFRQQQALGVITDYYGLLRRRRRINSAERNADQYKFLYDRSKALFDKGRMNLVDVFRAEEQMLQAENSLNDERAAYNFALDRFKITLGLPTAESVDVADRAIEPQIVSVEVEGAVKTALANRLDLMTTAEQLEDAKRRVLVARNGLLPALEFFARANAESEAGGDIFDYRKDDGSVSAGLQLELPLDQKAERNVYKEALVSYDRSRRSFMLAQDNAILDVRQTVRNLRQAEFTLVIQQRQLDSAKDRLESAYLLVEKGEASNRDIVEAQTSLLDAENALLDAQVAYVISYIQLLKDMGTLRVDEKGQWH